MCSGASISYWVTKPAADGEKIGSTLFRVAHGSADTSGGAVITGAYAFETHERDVAAVFVERTKKLSESAFGSDEATVAYVAFDAVAGNDGDVEGTGTDAAHSCAVVALAERRDKTHGRVFGVRADRHRFDYKRARADPRARGRRRRDVRHARLARGTRGG